MFWSTARPGEFGRMRISLEPGNSKPASGAARSRRKPKLVVLPDPNPRVDIYRTRFRIHPLIQQKLIAQARLWQKMESLRSQREALLDEWNQLTQQIDDDLLRIADGKDPWSDPMEK